MKRLLTAVFISLLYVVLPISPAVGKSPTSNAEAMTTKTGARVEVGASRGASSGGGRGRPRRGTSTVRCTARNPLLAGMADGLGAFLGATIDSGGPSRGLRWQICTDTARRAVGLDPTTGRWVFPSLAGPAAAPPPAADVIAQQAAAELELGLPDVATAPPRRGLQLAGVRVWFWASGAAPRQATASVPGLSATVTAEPLRLRLTTDGTTIACTGLGLPYPTRDTGGSPDTRPCTHVFQDRGRHQVTATISWRLRWEATDGTAGTLPDLDRTTTFVLAVSEGRAVTD